MEKTKVLFVCQEITPYLPETEMSVRCRYLPQGIQDKGREIRSFMPRYGLVNERRNQLHEVIRLSGMNLVINDTDHPLIIKVASIQSARMQIYFIDNDDYFHRKHILTDDNGKFFEDNDERAIFFARGVIETIRKLRWAPDIIHCHGWITSMMPLLIKKAYSDDPLFQSTKIIYSLYNDGFENNLDKMIKEKLLIDSVEESDVAILEKPTFFNSTRLAIDLSDGVIAGSNHIDPEVLEYAKTCGKPFLPYLGMEDYIDAYSRFFDKIHD